MFEKNKLKPWIKSHSHQLNLVSIYCVGLLFFGILLLFVHRIAHSDDYTFQTQIQPYHTLFDWVSYRYNSWSGRIFAESFVYIFSPLSIFVWKLVTLLHYAAFSGILFLYYILISAKRSPIKDYVMMIFALILPLMMNVHVLTEGMLWVTGSMNYFWLSVFGLIGFYSISYYVVNKEPPHWSITVISLITGFIAASSHEQIGAILVCMSLLFTLYGFFILKLKGHSLFYIVGFTALFLTAFLIGILAPGNHVRIASETITWLPDFYTIPVLEHLEYSYRWLLDAVINRFGLLLVVYWTLLITLFVAKKRALRLDKLDYVIATVLGISAVLTSFKGFGFVNYWFQFYASWHSHAPRISVVILLVWTIALIATIIAPIVLYRKKVIGLLLSGLVCAVIASTALVMLSPTMYASGSRTLYVPSMILVISNYILFIRTFDQNKKIIYLLTFMIITLGASQYLYQLISIQ